MNSIFRNGFYFIIVLSVVILVRLPAQTPMQDSCRTDSIGISGKIELYVRWTDKKIEIDGILNEAAWDEAVAYEDYFYQLQPLDRVPSSEKTRVMVLQDDKMIYFGIQCYDSEPDKIFASSMRRDMNYGSGEVIELLLDTFRDNRNCYAFDTNPLGGKGDAIIGDQGNHVNKQWECVIYMDGARNEQGWAAEFAIPFKSLKYKEGEIVDWGINITREIKHRQEETYLVPIPRAWGHMAKFRGELFGLLRNIRPPQHGFNFELYPYLLAGRTAIYGEDAERKNEFTGGIDFKYDITPQLALDLTLNTDFAQAESEEEIVNVTRFNVLRQEKREFFLQSAGLFQFGSGQRNQTNFLLFDSRTIGIQERQRIPLLGGGKLTGRAGKYSIAILNLQSEGTDLEEDMYQPSTNYTVLRLKRDVSKNSHIGLMAQSHQATSSNYSRAFGLDGLWNVSESIRLDASAARSFSRGVDSRDMAGDAAFILNKEWLDINLRYTHIDSLFNPKMGFVLRPNIRSIDGVITFTKWVNGHYIQNAGVSSGLVYTTDHHRILQTRDNSFTASLLSSGGDEIKISAIRSYEYVPGKTSIRDIQIDAGVYNTWRQSIGLNSYRARPITVSSTFQWGQLFDGHSQSLNLSGTAKASNHLSFDLAYTYNYLDLKNGTLQSHVWASRWTYSFTPDLFAKIYLQQNTADERFAVNFIIDYAYRPRSHIYLVYNENQDTWIKTPMDRIIMLKMTYLWQI
jgi:hypothetical protein